MTLYEEIGTFIAGRREAIFPKSLWFSDNTLKVYLRAGPRYHATSGSILPTVTIANIEVDSLYRRRGHFASLLSFCEAQAAENGYSAVMVESVLNKILVRPLLDRGYLFLENHVNYGEGMGDYLKVVP